MASLQWLRLAAVAVGTAVAAAVPHAHHDHEHNAAVDTVEQKVIVAEANGYVPVARPFPLSDVTLDAASPFAIAQQRNKEFITSLDISELGCIFTSAANLTQCGVTSFWQTYLKNGTGYNEKMGFLALGNDFKPAFETTFATCDSTCTSAPTCLGFAFQASDPAAQPVGQIKCYTKTKIAFVGTSPTGNCPSAGQQVSHGLQLQSIWIILTAAESLHVFGRARARRAASRYPARWASAATVKRPHHEPSAVVLSVAGRLIQC